MYNSELIADFFIDYNNHSIDDTISNLKLNKLLYFAQGYSLALFDKPLFSDNIEAWEYGPVIPKIYHKYKRYGRRNIAKISKNYSYNNIDIDTVELLLAVIRDYGKYSSSKLINITHKKGSPWDLTYNNNQKNIITNKVISEYFKTFKIDPIETNFDKIETVDILPADWDDGEDYTEYLTSEEYQKWVINNDNK